MTATATTNMGFITVLQEANGYLGGFLVTNAWGRPIEFRLTTSVQPNRVQKILYADTLQSYICSELIGKTLVEKTNIAVQLLVTDTSSVLDLRMHLDTPVAYVARAARANPDQSAEPTQPEFVCPTIPVQNNIHCHGQFPQDAETIQEILNGLSGNVDLLEPFERVREAMGEARKMGVSSRG